MHLSQLQKLYLWWRSVIRALNNTYLGRLIRSKFLENPHLKVPFQAIPLWVASVLTGLVAVAYEHLFTVFENWGKRLFQLDERIIFITAPFFFILAWLVTKRFAPGARGSGIPQLMAAVDLAGTSRQNQISRLLSIRIALVKIFSSLLLLLGGGAIGREGPTLQTHDRFSDRRHTNSIHFCHPGIGDDRPSLCNLLFLTGRHYSQYRSRLRNEKIIL